MAAYCSERPVRSAAREHHQLITRTQAYIRLRQHRIPPGAALAAAWEQFYGLYTPRIRCIVASCGLRGGDLEECVQDVWLLVFQKLPSLAYDPARGRFDAWLYCLVRCRAIDQLRRRARRDLNSPAALRALHHHLAGRRDLSPAGHHDDMERLAIALTRLRSTTPEQSYRVFYLRRLRERPIEEVARELNLTPAQVRARHHRVEQKLRAMLRPTAAIPSDQ